MILNLMNKTKNNLFMVSMILMMVGLLFLFFNLNAANWVTLMFLCSWLLLFISHPVFHSLDDKMRKE